MVEVGMATCNPYMIHNKLLMQRDHVYCILIVQIFKQHIAMPMSIANQ